MFCRLLQMPLPLIIPDAIILSQKVAIYGISSIWLSKQKGCCERESLCFIHLIKTCLKVCHSIKIAIYFKYKTVKITNKTQKELNDNKLSFQITSSWVNLLREHPRNAIFPFVVHYSTRHVYQAWTVFPSHWTTSEHWQHFESSKHCTIIFNSWIQLRYN